MEKLEKKKNNHKPTKWLKFTVFAVIMLAPFFSVLARTIYVQSNPNAKDSYSDIKIQSSVNINDISYYTEGQLYYFEYKAPITTGTNAKRLEYISLTKEQLNCNQEEYNSLTVWWLNVQGRIYFANSDATVIKYIAYTSNLSFQFKGQITQEYIDIAYINRIILTTETLDNAFEYSINKLKENNLYNWSTETGIYTAIERMTNGLGANEVLAMLLAYWSILTAIYIVFDIVIECFTKLTHMLTE